MKISKWGNSLAIRVPAAVVEALNLKAGDEIDIRATGGWRFVVERKMTREEAIQKLRTSGTQLPPGFKFSREEANAR